MGILQYLLTGQSSQPPAQQGFTPIQSLPQQDSGVAANILSQRFQPSSGDVTNSIQQNVFGRQGGGWTTPEDVAKTSLSDQILQNEAQAGQMKNQMTAFQMPLMQRQMQMMSGALTGQPTSKLQPSNNIPGQMQQNATGVSNPAQNPNYNTDSRVTMAKLAASMGNEPLAKAYQFDYENDPATIARTKGIEAKATGEQTRLNESQKTALDIQKNINDDADTALKTKRILGEMGTLSKTMTPGKYAGFNKSVAEWKIANGIGTPTDQELASSSQGIDKLTAQLATQAMTEFTKRGTQMEFKTFLANNPNIGMTPGGFQTLLAYMDKTSNLPLQKQQDFIKWKSPNGQQRPLSEYPDFDAQWNQSTNQNLGNTLQPPTDSTGNASLLTPEVAMAEAKRRGLLK